MSFSVNDVRLQDNVQLNKRVLQINHLIRIKEKSNSSLIRQLAATWPIQDTVLNLVFKTPLNIPTDRAIITGTSRQFVRNHFSWSKISIIPINNRQAVHTLNYGETSGPSSLKLLHLVVESASIFTWESTVKPPKLWWIKFSCIRWRKGENFWIGPQSNFKGAEQGQN